MLNGTCHTNSNEFWNLSMKPKLVKFCAFGKDWGKKNVHWIMNVHWVLVIDVFFLTKYTTLEFRDVYYHCLGTRMINCCRTFRRESMIMIPSNVQMWKITSPGICETSFVIVNCMRGSYKKLNVLVVRCIHAHIDASLDICLNNFCKEQNIDNVWY